MKKVSLRLTHCFLLSLCTAVLLILIVPDYAQAQGPSIPSRPIPPTDEPSRNLKQDSFQPQVLSAAPNYCSSSGGNTNYERIQAVQLTPNVDGSFMLQVDIFIANPDGCMSGQACPVYDDSPEYLNAWLDWNGNRVWEPNERVLDKALTGYLGINYRGTMTAVTNLTAPGGATSKPTWLRVNLGWGGDPNDPCQSSWGWGNVIDKQVHTKPPQVVSLTAEGCKFALAFWPHSCIVHTRDQLPETGNKVRLNAQIDVPSGYEVTKCTWSGDLTAGEGDVKDKCRYDYVPNTGTGPSTNTYGNKNVRLTVTYKDTLTGATGQTFKDLAYQVYFPKHSDDDGDGTPNWFEYWKANGAVTRMSQADVLFDSSLGSDSYGYWAPSDDNIHIGKEAAETHYSSGLSIPSSSICPGGAFGGAQGINSIAEVVIHEGTHKWIHHNWDPGGTWNGLTDSDRDKPSAGYIDSLPDAYEISTTRTSNDNVDSCSLATRKDKSYATYGDNEFAAMRAAHGATGIAANDWANPGQQTGKSVTALANVHTLPMTTVNTEGVDNVNRDSGITGALYSSYTYPTPGFARLTGQYSEAAVDSDSDGTIDELHLTVGLEVQTSSQYNVIVWLEDPAGTPVAWARTQAQITATAAGLDIIFPGPLLAGTYQSGPYNVRRVELRTGDRDVLVEAVDNVYVTAAYTPQSFRPPDVTYAGPVADVLVDDNGNGLADRLHIDVPLQVRQPGDYTIVAEMYGTGPVVAVMTTTNLLAGVVNVPLDLSGIDIFRSRQDGPYQLRALRVEDSTGALVTSSPPSPISSAYSYLQFEHSGITISATDYVDTGMDIDNDGDYDYLRLDMGVFSDRATTDQHLIIELEDKNGVTIETKQLGIALNSGMNAVIADFAGNAIFAHGVDGPYQVASVTLLDEDGNVIDAQHMGHATQAYAYTNFSPTSLQFTKLYGDQGQDTDANGLFDSLAITLQLLSNETGIAIVEARLADDSGVEVATATANVQSTAGVPLWVTLHFSGPRLRWFQANGPYTVRNLIAYMISDPTLLVYAADDYVTAPYTYQQFDEPLKLVGPSSAVINSMLAFTLNVASEVGLPASNVLWTATDQTDAIVENVTSTATQLYQWATPGTKTILVQFGTDGTIITKTHTVHVYAPVTADFAGSPGSGVAPLQISFSSLATGEYDSLTWDFGDGTSLTGENPTHIYTQAGAYTVTLIASGPGGVSKAEKAGYITVYAKTVAAFAAAPVTGEAPLNVTFTNQSSGSFSTVQWTFGDGTESHDTNPVHMYTVPGIYTATLTTSGPGGTATATAAINVKGPVGGQVARANFSMFPTAGQAPLLVNFQNLSAGAYTASLWDFGDGSTSTEHEPTHLYTLPGIYSIKLLVSGPGGEDTMVLPNAVSVTSAMIDKLYMPLLRRQ